MTIELGVIFSVITAVLGVLGYQVNRTNQQLKKEQIAREEARKKEQIAREEANKKQKEVKDESHQDAKFETQLDYISRGVDDIRIDLKANEKRINDMREELARVDESSKQAHKRIDKLDSKLEGGVIRHG